MGAKEKIVGFERGSEIGNVLVVMLCVLDKEKFKFSTGL